MRRILIPAIAGCVLAAYAGPLSAQGPAGREGPGGGPPGGGQPGGMRSPGGPGGAGPQREMNAPRATQSERGSRVDRPGRGAEGPPRGIERNRQAEPQQPNRQRERATEREQNRAIGEQRRNPERERNAERARSAERERAARDQNRVDDRQRRRAGQPDVRRDRQAGDRVKGGDRITERREEMRQARDRLGPPERQRLHAAFDFRRARVTDARFDHHVGQRVPRHVRLFPVSREIISFFPYYRDYSYVVVDDEICIVDPRTYEIVDVIDQGYYRGGPRHEVAGFSLSSAHIAFVRDSIPRDFPATPFRLRLALGAEVPGDVELYEFPVIVLDRVRELRDYRFLVVEEQIVIVDPRDRSIALVIDRA
jgi:Protein of unknown function (DUF1236)